METLRWKTRIAVLWVFMVVADLAHGLLVTWEPGGVEKMVSHMVARGSGWFLFEAFFFLVPLCMAFVSMTVKDSLNRWINFVLGTLFTTINIIHFFQCGVPLGSGPITEPTAHHILLVGSTVVVTAVITWHAWNWPEQEA